MKYIVILGDGMADYPLEALGNKTPLDVANKPNIDALTKMSTLGLVKTIPDDLPPGSDTANLSVMGYDPKKYYTGRSPLEAASIGISLEDNDVTFRVNLVHLSDEEDYANKTMIDYSSDEITTQEAHELISAVAEKLGNKEHIFYKGISYRHILVWKNGLLDFDLTPPHDISGKKVASFLPKGKNSSLLLHFMKKSAEILKDHPVNQNRASRGLKPATSIWIWGQGKKAMLPSFFDLYHVTGGVVSAVDLIKGIGISAGLKSVEVEGATGNIHTNFEGKAKAAIELLKSGKDFVYLHIEAPDECGHRFEVENKVRAIELIDEKIVAPIVSALEKSGEDYSILLLPDHPTPLALGTHTHDPVPYLIFRSTDKQNNVDLKYTETHAFKTGEYIAEGYTLMEKFLKTNLKKELK